MRPFTPALFLALLLPAAAGGGTLVVGPGKTFSRPEEALAKAKAGDVIEVHPLAGGRPYERVALPVDPERITIRAAGRPAGPRVALSGKGFDYSGAGRTPRAIVQFNPGAEGGALEGFALSGAHNDTHNGAGVRINQANRVTLRDLEIHGNDMGVMSNGDGSGAKALDQRIERCLIHGNGDPARPGYNHNLYLGGASVLLRFCEVHGAITGHNVKSRAAHTRVEYSYIHDSANREFDLVDEKETAAPGSHAVLLGNVIVKRKEMEGNKTVIHFGQDGGGGHDGTLFLAYNTIVTPYLSPVVDLSAPKARASLTGNIVWDGGAAPARQSLVEARGGAALVDATGSANWLSAGFGGLGGTGLRKGENTVAAKGAAPPFENPAGADFRLARKAPGIADAGPPAGRLGLPPFPGARDDAMAPPLSWRYLHPAGGERRTLNGAPDLGAYEGPP